MLDVQMLHDNELLLTQEMARGTCGDEKYVLCMTVPFHSLIVEYKNKKAVVSIAEVVKDMINYIEIRDKT